MDDSLRTHLKIMSFELRSFNHFYIKKVQSGAGEGGWGGVEWGQCSGCNFLHKFFQTVKNVSY